MVHGYTGSGIAAIFNILKQLVNKYKIVFFDNFGWGMNTKLQECPRGMESPEAAEQWCIEWILKTFDALELPEKFLLYGHSMGGWIASIYASLVPHRVESLLLLSPGGTEHYNEETYDPYTLRDTEDVSV